MSSQEYGFVGTISHFKPIFSVVLKWSLRPDSYVIDYHQNVGSGFLLCLLYCTMRKVIYVTFYMTFSHLILQVPVDKHLCHQFEPILSQRYLSNTMQELYSPVDGLCLSSTALNVHNYY